MHQFHGTHWRKPYYETLQVRGIKDALRLELLQSLNGEIRDEAALGWQRQWLIELTWENSTM
jgi:hypothetical protein